MPEPEKLEKPPELVFTPDERAAARVARTRILILVLTILMLAVAFIWVFSYRPRIKVEVPAVVAPDTGVPGAAIPRRSPEPARSSDAATLAARAIDSLAARAGEKWVRITELMPPGQVTKDAATDAVSRLRKAVILAESAKTNVTSAKQQVALLLASSRSERGARAYRLSVLYAAADRYVKLLGEEAGDRVLHCEMMELSVKAVLADDPAEAETKANVAMSYLRRSDERQRSLLRLARQMQEALGNLAGGG